MDNFNLKKLGNEEQMKPKENRIMKVIKSRNQ